MREGGCERVRKGERARLCVWINTFDRIDANAEHTEAELEASFHSAEQEVEGKETVADLA